MKENNENRTLIAVLHILLDTVIKHQRKLGLCTYICVLLDTNVISEVEYDALRTLIRRNKPKWYSSINTILTKMFYQHYYTYWQPYYTKPRIKWIKNQILLLERGDKQTTCRDFLYNTVLK